MSLPAEISQSLPVVIRRRLADYLDLMKPRILLLAVLTVLGAMSLASPEGEHRPTVTVTLATLVGVALAVGAGGALNNFIERNRDARMDRTAQRPLPAGRMKPTEALVFGTVLWISSYFILYFLVNPPTAFLTMLAFGSYVGIYTPLKSRTTLCTLAGAIPGAMPPLIGWTAIRGHLEWSGVLLFAILFLWQIPHFLALAISRREEYARAGMPMLPSPAGVGGRGVDVTLNQILLYTAALVPVSLLPYGVLGAGRVYFVLALALGAGFVFLAVRGFVRAADARWCKSFFLYSIFYLVLLFGTLVFGS